MNSISLEPTQKTRKAKAKSTESADDPVPELQSISDPQKTTQLNVEEQGSDDPTAIALRDAEPRPAEVVEPEEKDSIKYVGVELLKAHSLNKEIYGDEDVDEELVKSIKEDGITSPLIIDENYTIISGHRRVKVAISLKLSSVPVIFRTHFDETEKINELLSSNIQRRKSNEVIGREAKEKKRIESERALKRKQHAAQSESATNENGKSRDIVGDAVGLSGPTVDKMIKVVDAIDELVKEGKVDKAKELRAALNKSASRGYKAGQELGLITKMAYIVKPKAKTAEPPPPSSTALPQLPAPRSPSGGVPVAPASEEKKDTSPYEADSTAIESHGAALKIVREITAFITEIGAEDLSDDERDTWEKRFAELRAALIEAEIIDA